MSRNLERVHQRVHAAAARVGRDPQGITLVGVSKGQPLERVLEAVEAGVRHLGESRVQEARQKIPAVQPPVTWHLVGHLQRNKVRPALQLFHWIDSLDSLGLAREIHRRAAGPLPVLLEVNVTGERGKHGFRPQELPLALAELLRLERLSIRGLMTLAAVVDDPRETRPAFRALRRLRDELARLAPQLEILSMGMSQDYEVAIEEGATMIRLGTALFGPRHAP